MRRQIRFLIAIIALVAFSQAVRALTPPQRALMLGAKQINSGGGGGGGACNGTISLAAGCALPMFGGL